MSSFSLLSLALVGLLGCSWLAEGSSVPGCSGTANLLPAVTTSPQLIRKVPNGQLYHVPVDNLGPPLNVLHLWGTPYQMGYAQGQLVADSVREFYEQVPAWMDDQIGQYLQFLPKEVAQLIEEAGVASALQLEVWATQEYTPQHFKDEMRGLADATGVSYDHIYRYTMLPELIKAACSMMGAWGTSVQGNNPLIQLRALDWGTNGPFQKFPAVVVYHPEPGQGHAFASVTWLGFVGSITGYSSAPLGICEKVWLSYNETSARLGIPFHFLMRDIQQFDSTVDAALSRIAEADRTCSVWLGLGTPQEKFTAVGYSYEEVNIWDWATFPVWENHPRIQDVVYIDKHVQPSHNPCLAGLIQAHIPLSASDIYTYITAELQTGDMHAAVFDFGANTIYVSNASPFVNGTVTPAYNRPFVRLNMTELFSTTP